MAIQSLESVTETKSPLSFGESLREYRKAVGMTQGQFVEQFNLGITASGLSLIESNQRFPAPKTMAAFEDAGFNVGAAHSQHEELQRQAAVTELAGRIGLCAGVTELLKDAVDLDTALQSTTLNHLYGPTVARGIETVITTDPEINHHSLVREGVQLAVEKRFSSVDAQAALGRAMLEPVLASAAQDQLPKTW